MFIHNMRAFIKLETLFDQRGSVMISALLLLLQGRFTIAAKHHISIAEIYESELVDIEKVILS